MLEFILEIDRIYDIFQLNTALIHETKTDDDKPSHKSMIELIDLFHSEIKPSTIPNAKSTMKSVVDYATGKLSSWKFLNYDRNSSKKSYLIHMIKDDMIHYNWKTVIHILNI